MNEKNSVPRKYRTLVLGAGIGSMLGSGIIVGLSATITVWQNGLNLSNSAVGILSGALTFAIAFWFFVCRPAYQYIWVNSSI